VQWAVARQKTINQSINDNDDDDDDDDIEMKNKCRENGWMDTKQVELRATLGGRQVRWTWCKTLAASGASSSLGSVCCINQ